LIGNNPSTTSFGNGTIINVFGQKAAGFTLPKGFDYTLDSITLRLSVYTDATRNPLLQIYADPAKTSSNPNGTTLQSVLFNKPSSVSNSSNTFTFIPTSTFTFRADTRYWLLVDNNAPDLFWNSNDDAATNTPIGISGIIFEGYQASQDNGSNYFNGNGVTNAFDIQATQVATPVPFDFDPSFGVAVLGGGWLLRKHLKKKKSTKV
jgi:hypothetical protein